MKKHKDSISEILLMKHLREVGIFDFKRELCFHPDRNWRLDFCFMVGGRKIAIEIEGGNYGTYDRFGRWRKGEQGGHHRPAGFEKDIRKYNAAMAMGIEVFRFTPNMVERGESKAFLKELFVGAQP